MKQVHETFVYCYILATPWYEDVCWVCAGILVSFNVGQESNLCCVSFSTDMTSGLLWGGA